MLYSSSKVKAFRRAHLEIEIFAIYQSKITKRGEVEKKEDKSILYNISA